jgi:hypothetical protein
MYLISLILLLFVFPALSVAAEALWLHNAADLMLLIGKWFVFWAVGVRLFLAGIRQVVQPQFTAEGIFDVKDRSALPMVREIGFGNLSMGALGLLTLAEAGWLVPAAIAGGLYYGLAGVGHAVCGSLNRNGWIALITDLLMFVLLAVFVLSRV